MGKTRKRPGKGRRAATNTALRMARSGLRMQQKEVAVRIGGSTSQVKEIDNGRKTLSRTEYEEAMGNLGVPPFVAPVLLGVAEVLDGETPEPDELFALPAQARLERERAALEAAEETRRSFDEEAYALRFAADRREAAELWQQLAAVGADRRKPLAAAARFHRWALAERLSQESVRAAPHDPLDAVSLARLALGVAGRVRGPAPFRGRLEAFGRWHLGNALRVGNDLDGGDREFARAKGLWIPPEPGEPCPLDEGRRLDLEASLRRAQRRFPEALVLIDQALARAAGGPATGQLLHQKAVIFEQAGDSAAAVMVLREALPKIDTQGEERHRLGARFNLVVNLLALGRVAEAAALVPVVRAIALAQSLDFDLLRVDWLEGRLAAGEGRRNEAIAQIAEAADRFAERNMPYDAALAALDLAALLLEAGRPAEAEARVAHAMPVFLAWGIDREALASLRLFLEAIEQQRATAALARAAAVAWRNFGGVPPRKRVR